MRHAAQGAKLDRMKLFLALFVLFALTASAADLAGTWKASLETPNGNIESTFEFKVDGAKLTGSVTSQQMGTTPISDGKIEGDNFSFAVKREGPNGEFVINYKGTVKGDEAKMQISIAAFDRTFDVTAKRAK
jgi:hypothetical protein